MDWNNKRVHLMGIAGAGMSALIPLLHSAGAQVSGCDLQTLAHGCTADVVSCLGHDVSHVDTADILIYSTAVPGQHEELREARVRGLPVMTRASCLAELMRGHETVAVAGSHGKTTTTWMLAHILTCNKQDPLVMCGGSVESLAGSGGKAGAGHIFVAEVDESDGGFLHIDPHIAIVTNLEAEHIRHYGSYEALIQSMNQWLRGIVLDRAADTVPTADTEPTAETVPTADTQQTTAAIILSKNTCDANVYKDVDAPLITCSLDETDDADYTLRDIDLLAEGSHVSVWYRGAYLERVYIPVPGVHNILNALMAIAAARHIVPDCDISVVRSCERVERRFSVRACERGVRVVEDYGHHPTEISVTIAAAALAGGRVHVIFQPHRYSRTFDAYNDFISCFDAAYALAVVPIYAAHEEPIPGVTSRRLVESIAAHARTHNQHTGAGLVQYAAHGHEAVQYVCAHAQTGDTILVLGAGDIGALVPDVIEALKC